MLGELLNGRGPAMLGLERLPRDRELTRLAANQSRNPVHRPQLIEHRASDSRHAVGFELDASIHIEGIDGVHQAEDAGTDQVVQFHTIGKTLPDPFAVVANQRHVSLDQSITEIFVVRRILAELLELYPDLQDLVVGCGCRCHPILRDSYLNE